MYIHPYIAIYNLSPVIQSWLCQAHAALSQAALIGIMCCSQSPKPDSAAWCMHRLALSEVVLHTATTSVMQVPIISAYQPNPSLPAAVIDGIVSFFVEARELAPGLTDGSTAPAFNLRSLARAMQYVTFAAPLHGLQRALYDGFGMSFAGMLDEEGAAAIGTLVQNHILRGQSPSGLPSTGKAAPAALGHSKDQFVNIEVRPPLLGFIVH